MDTNIVIKNMSAGSVGNRTIDPSEGFSVSGNTLIINVFDTYKSHKHNCSATTSILDSTATEVLLKVESIDWVTGQQYPYKTQGCFLVQLEKGKRGKTQLGVDRVPCNCYSIELAKDYLAPAEVRKAIVDGRKIKRQGDFFFIEMKKRGNLDALLQSNHTPVQTKRGISIQHPEHPALLLGTGAWKAIQRKTMNHVKAD